MNPSKLFITIKYLIISTLVLTALSSSAQEVQFFKAIKTNNFGEVDAFLGKHLDLCIYENQDLYPKSQAIQKISNWIREKKVKSVSEVHSGHSGDNKSQYRVAQIEASDGLYRVFVYVSDDNGKKIIKKIQIDRF